MNDIILQKTTSRQQDEIRVMYYNNSTPNDIADQLGIEIDTVRFFIFGIDGSGKDKSSLYYQKSLLNSASKQAYVKNKILVLESIAGTGAEILSIAMGDLRSKVISKEVELSVDEMNKISAIVTNLDKICRLEAGTATETIEYVGLTTAQARELLMADPFAPKDVEVESTQLPWLKDE